jgi:DNA repair exonuclease SbcCD nuclease subunit
VIFSDVHVGAEHHDARRFDEALAFCKQADAAVFLNGDLIENAIVSGKAPGEMILEQALTPTEQVQEFVSKIKPLAKRGRIVGVTRGNHEARSRREAMLDLCELIAAHLEVPYFRVGGYVRFKHGGQVYAGAIHHGKSGAQNIWLELDKLLRIYPEADFVAAGHNHALAAREVYQLRIAPTGAEEVSRRWQVRTGTYLAYADYAREAALAPTAMGSPVLRFDPRKHHMEVDVRTLSWL